MSKQIYTKALLEEVVKKSKYLTEVFNHLEIKPSGGSYQRIKFLIKKYELDTSHFESGRRKGYLKSGIGKKKPHNEVLVDDKSHREHSYLLRRSLIESGEEYKCKSCGLGPTWNGKELTLEVDHINGNWSDCKKENLRFLCPNCHTQEPTSRNTCDSNKCENCNKKIHRASRWCRNCFGKNFKSKRKVKIRPNIDLLLQDIETLGYVGTGKKYGVSDNAIRKWVKHERNP